MPVGLSNLPQMVKSGLDLHKKPQFLSCFCYYHSGFPELTTK